MYTNSLLATLNIRKSIIRPTSSGSFIGVGGGGGVGIGNGGIGSRMVVDRKLSLRDLPSSSPISPHVRYIFIFTGMIALFLNFFFFFFFTKYIASKYIYQNRYHSRIAWREDSSWWILWGELLACCCYYLFYLVILTTNVRLLGRVGLIFKIRYLESRGWGRLRKANLEAIGFLLLLYSFRSWLLAISIL